MPDQPPKPITADALDQTRQDITGKEMCEFIAEVWAERTGVVLDPEKDIWEISATGELWPVFALYEKAKSWRAANQT